MVSELTVPEAHREVQMQLGTSGPELMPDRMSEYICQNICQIKHLGGWGSLKDSSWLVVWLEHQFYFPINLGNLIIPIDSYIFSEWWPNHQPGSFFDA